MSSKEVTKQDGATGINAKQVESFTKLLHTEPAPRDVLVNKNAGGSKYLPISIIETKLDEMFFGLWQAKNFRWQVVANEIVGSIELGVFHPVAKEWVWREGAGAVLIQQAKGSAITDIGSKIKNTLVKDFPHLKAECIKNAAKSLGVAFGRNLNRAYWDEYQPLSEKMQQSKDDEILALLDSAKTPGEINRLWKAHPEWHTNEVLMDVFIQRARTIQSSNGNSNNNE